MTEEGLHPGDRADRRRQAEERVKTDEAGNQRALSPEEVRHLLHELQVHQIELELQNEELIRAQGELEVARERYFDLYNLAPVGYFTVSDRGLILDTNLAAARLLGMAPADLAQQPISRFILPDDQDVYYHHSRRLLKTSALQACELRFVRPDTTVFWARLEATTAQDANGATTCRTVLTDISIRKRAEEAVQAAHDSLRTVLESITDAFFSLDRDFRLTYVNHEAEKVFRRARQEVLGKNLWEVFPEAARSRFQREYERAMAENATVHFEEFYPPFNQWYSVHAYPSPTGLSVYFEDITERKVAEERLRWELSVNSAQATLSQFLVASIASVDQVARVVLESARGVTHSAHGFVSSVDPLTGANVCHTLSDMMGQQCRIPGASIVFSRGADGMYPALWGHALNTGEAFYTNSPEEHPSFAGVPAEHVRVKNFLSAPATVAGHLVGQIALSNSDRPYTDRDLTAIQGLATVFGMFLHRLRVEEALRRAHDELEVRVQERTAELSGRAEQLRALAVELTQAEQRERRRLAQTLHDELQQMLVATRMKVGLLGRRVQDDHLVPTIAQIDDLLNQIIEETRSLATRLCPPVLHDRGLAAGLEWLGQQAEEKFGLLVEVEADPTADPTAETTRTFLFQVVNELLLNAAKHAQARHVWIRMSQSEQRVGVEVRDDGRGFDPAPAGAKTDRGGFGMFSIRERVAALGGQMDVVSSRGRGAQVMIWVPRSQTERPAADTSK